MQLTFTLNNVKQASETTKATTLFTYNKNKNDMNHMWVVLCPYGDARFRFDYTNPQGFYANCNLNTVIIAT